MINRHSEYDDEDALVFECDRFGLFGDYGRRRTPYWGPVGYDGRPVQRTKAEWPYSYSEFVIWRGGPNTQITGADYTDRLYQWDSDKFKRLCEKHMPKSRWDNAEPSKVEAFLREYHEQPKLRLLLIMEGCNASSGYPYWTLHYQIPKGT